VTPEGLRELIAGAETLDVEFKGEEARPGRSGAGAGSRPTRLTGCFGG
jgi:hypothetical protein